MTIFPRNLALLALVLVLGALTFFAGREGAVAQRQVLPLLSGFDATAVQELTIERDLITASGGGGETLRATLRRAPGDGPGDGSGRWIVDELEGASARSRDVDALLLRIGEMNDQDVLTEDPARLSQYGFGEGRATRILLVDAGGAVERIDVARGDGPGDPAFVRVGEGSRVVRVARFRIPSARPSAWLDRSPLVAMSPLDVQEMRFTGTALEKPLVATAPRGTMGEFEDADGNALDRALVRRLIDEELRLVPLGVAGRRDGAAGEPALRIEVVPRVGEPVAWELLSLGDPGASPPVPATAARADDGPTAVLLELAPSSVGSLLSLLGRIAGS